MRVVDLRLTANMHAPISELCLIKCIGLICSFDQNMPSITVFVYIIPLIAYVVVILPAACSGLSGIHEGEALEAEAKLRLLIQ